jgi:GNAT superfamily N-acetyltransferase
VTGAGANDSATTETPDAVFDYREPGRGFRSVAYWIVLLGAGFALDLKLGGGPAHLPGWIGATVIIVGLDLLVVHAARSTKTLTLTADEIRIGDEAIPRTDITAASEGGDPELPVLGWLTGMPRGVKAVTLRLTEDREALVPTRHPALLLRALGLGEADRLGARIEIRAADEDDLLLLDEIDERADTLFRVSGYALPEIALEDAVGPVTSAAAVFVAGRPPVAFARLDVLDGCAHLAAIAVLPGSMKQGLGSALIERACGWARDAGHPAITLTTYADIAWNGPMYARLGWVEVSDPSPALLAIRARERELGLDDVGRRCVMRREL